MLQLANGERLPWQPFPQITPASIPPTIESIAARRPNRLASYGGYLVRRGGWEAAELAMETYVRLVGADYAPVDFVGDGENILHTDEDMTVHWTPAGSAEAIVLVGCPDASEVTAQTDESDGRQLFETGFYAYARPAAAYRTVLQKDDVLIFDSSQVHVFRSLSRDRTSRGLVTV